MLRESDLRKADAQGVPIKLGNGEEWIFPRPRVGLAYEIVEGRYQISEKISRSFGAEYDQLVDGFLESGDGADFLNKRLALAVDLLKRNYGILPEDVPVLLPVWFGDEENQAMWTAIVDVALGRGPKPTPVG
jgi:hypothetical protein